MSKDEKKRPCDYCQTAKFFARRFDMHIDGEDCPYECKRYEKWKVEQKDGDGE